MISDNGNGRIHLVGQTDDAKEKKRRGMNATVGEMEDYLVSKSEEIWEFYRAQIPPIIMQMLQGGFAAYDHGRRETFDEIMAPLSRDGLSPEVCAVLDALQQVFGMPKPDIAPATEAPGVSGPLDGEGDEIDQLFQRIAEHGSPSLALPEVAEAARLIADVYDYSIVGGGLHVVVDDDNLGDDFLDERFANPETDTVEQIQVENECLFALRALTLEQRVAASVLSRTIRDERHKDPLDGQPTSVHPLTTTTEPAVPAGDSNDGKAGL